MEKGIRWMLRLRGLVVFLFLAAAVFCGVLSTMVEINYNIVDYLPSEAPSTVGLDLMDEIYDKAVPNTRVMTAADLNTYAVLDNKAMIITESSLNVINNL